jgi:hypothetical protein
LYDSKTILDDALVKGKQTLRDSLSDDERTKAWTDSRTSIHDILQAVNNARQIYQGKRSSKVWKWLTLFSTRVNHYSAILDVMVQHHPEYAALAWGAMKLLFVVSNLVVRRRLVDLYD